RQARWLWYRRKFLLCHSTLSSESCRWEEIESFELRRDEIWVRCRFPRPSPPVCAGTPATVQSEVMSWVAGNEDRQAPVPTNHRSSDIPSIASKFFVSAR